MSVEPTINVSKLPNLGAFSAKLLGQVGIHTRGELESMGPVGAFLAIRQSGESPSLNLLWAMAAALRNEHWLSLPDDVKQSLRNELERETGVSWGREG